MKRLLVPDIGAVHFVHADEDIDDVVKAVRPEPRVAMDTEADSLHHYYEKLCLIQVSVPGAHFIIDPLAGVSLAPLWEAMADKKIVLHGADYDLRLLRRFYHFLPNRIYDTSIAAQLLGYEEFGLSALVGRHFGVELPKSSQRADWSRRPLTDKMIAYAANDTRWLLELADILEAGLRDLGRIEWRRQSCERALEESRTDREGGEDERWRIRGWGRLDRRQLPLLKALWDWRESEAQRADRPTFRIVNNALLLEMARWLDGRPAPDIEDFPRLPRNLHGRRVGALRKAIQAARALSRDQWPTLPERRGQRMSAEVGKVIQAVRDRRNQIAEQLKLAPGVLAPNAALTNIVLTNPATVEELQQAGPLLPWQAQAVGEEFLAALSLREAAGEEIGAEAETPAGPEEGEIECRISNIEC